MINAKDLRSSVIARIVDQTDAGSTVYANKVTPHRLPRLPAISVYTPRVAAETVGKATPAFRRTVDIVVEVLAAGENAADQVDDIVLQVKEKLFTDATWVSLFESIAGYAEEHTVEDDGERPIAIGSLTLNVELVEPEMFATP